MSSMSRSNPVRMFFWYSFCMKMKVEHTMRHAEMKYWKLTSAVRSRFPFPLRAKLPFSISAGGNEVMYHAG